MSSKKQKMPPALKKLLITLLVLVILGGLGTGAYFLFKGEPEPVKVTQVMYISTYNWEEDSRGYGYIQADDFQQEYLSDTQIIEEILVSEGQQVKKGDVIAKYDSTLTELEVESQDLSVQLMQIDLEDAKAELEQFIRKYGPGRTSGSAATDTQEDTSEAPADESSDATDPAEQTSEEPTSEEPTTEEPATEEPTTEEPTTEEPTTEEPTTEELPIEEPTTEEPTTEEPTTEEPTTEEPTTEEPTTEEPTTEEPTTEEPESQEPTLAPYDPENPEKLDLPEPYAGKGTKRDPYRVVWRHGQELSSEYIWELLKGHRSVKIVFEVHEDDAEEGELLYSWTMTFENTGDHTYSTMINNVEIVGGVPIDPDFEDEEPTTEEEPTEEEPTDPDFPDFPDFPDEPEYTAEEIAFMRRELTTKVRDLDLKLRTEQQKLAKMRTELNNNTIVAKVDGEVTMLLDPEEAQMMNSAFVVISGGGGMYLHTAISELDLGKYEVGSTLSFMSWESGMTYEATITEISQFPITSGDTFSYNYNSNASSYPVTAYIEDAAGLADMSYGEVTFAQNMGNGDGSIYLDNAFIRKEGSRSYVMAVDENGKLEKRYVKTGKPLYGSYTEIRAGITNEDFLAFPYGSDVVEGAATETAAMDEMYMY